jgi:hypothetical protein
VDELIEIASASLKSARRGKLAAAAPDECELE